MNALEAEARLPIALHFPRPEGHEGQWLPQPMLKVSLPCRDERYRLELPALIDTGAARSMWPLSYARLLLGAAADELEEEPRIIANGVKHPGHFHPAGLDIEVGGYRVHVHAGFFQTKNHYGVLGLNDFLGQFDMVCRWADYEVRLYPRPSVALAAEAALEAA